MEEIIKYCLKKINISISVLCGVFVPGIYVWVVRNYDKFIEIDIIKILMMIIVMLLPSYVVSMFVIAVITMIVDLLFKNMDINKIREQILVYSAAMNAIIAGSLWKTNFVVDQDTIVDCLEMAARLSIPFFLFFIIEAGFEKKKNKNK